MSLQRSLGDANLFQVKEKQVFKLKEEQHVERSRMNFLTDQQEKELKMLQQKGKGKVDDRHTLHKTFCAIDLDDVQ